MERGCPYLYTGSKFRVIWPSVLIIQSLQHPPPLRKICLGKTLSRTRVKAFWEWLENIIKKLKADYAIFNIDSAVLIYGFNIENKTFKLLNFILNCAMFIIYKCRPIAVKNFESKQYSFIGLQNMLHQELKNQSVWCSSKIYSQGLLTKWN